MTRYGAAKAAIAITAVLALVLIAIAVLDAAWLGFVAIGLLLAILAAREVAVFGLRRSLLFAGAIMALIAIGFVAAELARAA